MIPCISELNECMSDEVELSAQVLIVAVLETLSLIVKVTAYHVVWTKYKDLFVKSLSTASSSVCVTNRMK